jgi:hypothetical protein
MFTRILSAAAVGVLLIGGAFVQSTRASGWSHRELITVNAPIALPGVVLAAGTYSFELPAEGSPTIVRVSSQDQRHVYLTQFTLDVARPNNEGVPKMTFGEAAAGTARPVKVWYPDGSETGKQFLYN